MKIVSEALKKILSKCLFRKGNTDEISESFLLDLTYFSKP